MKKLIITAVAFLVINLLSAQTFGIGLRAGVAINQVSEDKLNEIKSPLTINTAFVSELNISKHFSLQAEIAQTNYKSIYEIDNQLFNGEDILSSNHLGFNIIPKFKLPISDKLESFAMLGFGYSMQIDASYVGKYNVQNFDYGTDNFNKKNLIGIVGIGASYQINNFKIFIDQRFNQSFENIMNSYKLNQISTNIGLIYEL